jgi:ubiquinone/menaquinone biosynthesis C-methylase UbiE
VTYAEQLRLANRLTEPVIQQIVDELQLPAGSTGLDAGCGIGLRTLVLADAVGEGRVTGLDISPDNLAAARERVARSPFAQRVELVEGDLRRIPFEAATFDWVWCADTLWSGHVVTAPTQAVTELARVVRPGGTVALVYWSSQSLLPGHPTLEARLNEVFTARTPYLARIPPEQHFMRAMHWLRAAGLSQVRARSYVAELHTPPSPELREALAYCFSMFWGELEPHLQREDWIAYQRLCEPASPDFIADRPDYYGFLTYTLFSGRVG